MLAAITLTAIAAPVAAAQDGHLSSQQMSHEIPLDMRTGSWEFETADWSTTRFDLPQQPGGEIRRATWELDDTDELYAINKNGNTGTEVTIFKGGWGTPRGELERWLADSSRYLKSAGPLRTGIPNTGANDEFELADFNKDGVADLWRINKSLIASGGNVSLEIVVGVDEPNQVFKNQIFKKTLSLSTSTLKSSSMFRGLWDFVVEDVAGDPRPDIVAIQKEALKPTRVWILDGTNDTFTSSDALVTALGPTDATWQFDISDYDGDGRKDLWAFRNGKDNGCQGAPQVEIFSGHDNFNTSLVKANTPVAPGSATKFLLGLARWEDTRRPDLFAINPAGQRSLLTVVDSKLPGGRSSASIALGRQGDNKLVEVGVAANGHIYQRVQKEPGGDWDAWAKQPGVLTTVAIDADAGNRLVEIGVGALCEIRQRQQSEFSGSWEAFSNVSGHLKNVALARAADGRLVEVGVNRDGQIWERRQSVPYGPSWEPFELQLGTLVNIAIERDGLNRLVEVGVAANGDVFERIQKVPGGAWDPWVKQPGSLKNIAIARTTDDRLVEVGVNSDGHIYERWQLSAGGPWGGFAKQDGQLTTVTMDTNIDGRLVQVGVDSIGDIWERERKTSGAGWEAWKKQPGKLAAL